VGVATAASSSVSSTPTTGEESGGSNITTDSSIINSNNYRERAAKATVASSPASESPKTRNRVAKATQQRLQNEYVILLSTANGGNSIWLAGV
jgi:hypothetical protein